MTSQSYDLIVVGSGFAGCMTALNFLETCERLNKPGRVALVEAGKKGERCGASRWTGAFLRLDQDYNFDEDWIQEMTQVSNGQADLEYCRKLGREAKASVEFVENHGVKFVKHEEKNVSGLWTEKDLVGSNTDATAGPPRIQNESVLCHA